MSQETSTVQTMITDTEIAERFGIQMRTLRKYIREGRCNAIPVAFKKRRNRPEMRAIHWRFSRSEFRRLESEGFRFPTDKEVTL
jgi:transcription initiation factor IIE alpha subunit